jgi:FixJ family two-component response regulator
VKSALRNFVIYVVDDDDDVREGFARLLTSAGLNVQPYPSAETFLDKADLSGPGCLLLDVTMPGVTGPETLRRLKARGSALPVVVVSAHDDQTIQRLVYDLGAKMFLRKPVDDQALLDAINWVTQAHQTR